MQKIKTLSEMFKSNDERWWMNLNDIVAAVMLEALPLMIEQVRKELANAAPEDQVEDPGYWADKRRKLTSLQLMRTAFELFRDDEHYGVLDYERGMREFSEMFEHLRV